MWPVLSYAFELVPQVLVGQFGAKYFCAAWGMVTLCAVAEGFVLARCRRSWPGWVLPVCALVFLAGSVPVVHWMAKTYGNVWYAFGAAILDTFAVYALLGTALGALGRYLWCRYRRR